MRLTCPLCGARDLREFAYRGDAVLMERPAGDAGGAAFHAYVHLRANPAGRHDELWHHAAGCRAWIVVTRDTVTHDAHGARLARERLPAGGG